MGRAAFLAVLSLFDFITSITLLNTPDTKRCIEFQVSDFNCFCFGLFSSLARLIHDGRTKCFCYGSRRTKDDRRRCRVRRESGFR